MPIPIPEAIEESAELAVTKAAAARRMPQYLVSSALAGVYIGVAIVLLVSATGPFAAAHSAAAKLVAGCVFGIALTLVVFAGAELFTGNVMVMFGGLLSGRVRLRDVVAVNVASLVGNFVGSVAFSAMVHASGALAAGSKGTTPAPAAAMIASLAHGKIATPGGQLFWRAVLCNMLVCLAMWMAARTRSDSAKLVVLFWGLFAFVTAGFEHSIANMTVFSLAVFQGNAHWSDLARNLLYTVPGNIVGGALLVAMPYVWVSRSAKSPATRPNDIAVELPEPAAV
jgi:nitrite transporter NirC